MTANNKLHNKNSDTKIDAKTITENYCTISNKIQLKNLQMKVGNSKRRVDKLEKLYDGSISTLVVMVFIMVEEVVGSREGDQPTFQGV